jgi:hypothetical protein
MKTILLLILSLILVGCTTVNRPSPEAAALVDIGTTAVALSRGATELNPLGLVGSSLLKGVYLYNQDKIPPQDREFADKLSSSLWIGAAANNIAVMLGIVSPFHFAIGIVVGIIIYNP